MRFLSFLLFYKTLIEKKHQAGMWETRFPAFSRRSPRLRVSLWETCFWFSMGFPHSSNPGAIGPSGVLRNAARANDRINLSIGF